MKPDYYVKLVRTRLADDGNETLGNKPQVYTEEQILSYLEGSLQRLNGLLPNGLSFEATPVQVFELADLVVQGAVITALASKALLEKGREFPILDGVGSVAYHPPNVSDTMMRQWEVEMMDYRSKIELIRSNFSQQHRKMLA